MKAIAKEPAGFVAAIRLSMFAAVGIAVGFGWKPEFDVAAVVILPVVAAVEGWTTWWVRSVVTPTVTAEQNTTDAVAAKTQEIGAYLQGAEDAAPAPAKVTAKKAAVAVKKAGK